MRRYVALIISLLIYSCQGPGPTPNTNTNNISGKIIIFHAGSLSVPFQILAKEFEAEHPGTEVMLESSGSLDCARKITDLHKACDLMASSDYNVIEKLLIPDYTDWHLPFAGNEMVLAYTGESKYGDRISTENWHEILLRDDVRYGRSDPDTDPCGYRSLMVMQLAEQYYHVQNLAHNISAKDRKYIRPKEVDLLAMLELHETDYIFIYRSVAVQHDLKYITFPDEINLEKMEMNEHYSMAGVSIKGNTPSSQVEMRGEAITYSVTMIKSSPNPLAAGAFLEFLLDSEKGMKILTESGHISLLPVRTDRGNHIPDFLKKYTH